MDQKTESKRIKRFYIIIVLFCITGKSAERHIFAVLKISEKTFTVHKRRESKKASYISGENHNISQEQNLYTEASPKSIYSERQRKEKTVRDTSI